MSDDSSQALSLDAALALLQHGEMTVRGLLPGSSNYTFLAEISNQEAEWLAVYKPSQGETPLWDFPHGTLCNREQAAFLVSQALGWGLIPPTVLRIGPYGKGAVQIFIDADFEEHYFTFQDNPVHRPVLQQIAAFDLVVNNADRKGGHCLLDRQGRLWAIDHGVCFHVQPKLRTVIWEFAGEPLPEALLAGLSGLRSRLNPGCQLHRDLSDLLSPAEVQALTGRVDGLLADPLYPGPHPQRRSYPWPPV